MKNNELKNKLSQSFVPFSVGSEKYPSLSSTTPGPGSYKLSENFSSKSKNQTSSFFVPSNKSKIPRLPQLPGPGSYNFEKSWTKPVFFQVKRKKLIYETVPSFPSTSVGFSESNESFLTKTTQKSPKSLKGISFAKAPRNIFLSSDESHLGPGTYDPDLFEKKLWISFPKSRKNYFFLKEICRESYYNEEFFSCFNSKSVPKNLQNFGNRCERKTVAIKVGPGPGHYNTRNYKDQRLCAAPFNTKDTRFKSLFNKYS